jgi:lauroyl/myristoyl acyltransferase
MGTILLHLPDGRFREQALELVNLAEIERATPDNSGTVIAGLHLGPNVAIPLILAQVGYEVSVLGSKAVISFGRPLVEACLKEASSRIRWLTTEDQHVLLEARTALRQGRLLVGFFDDLSSTAPRRASVDMLGQRVHVPLTLLHLAAATGVHIIPASIVRASGPRYRMTLDTALPPPARTADALTATASELVRVAEHRISEHSEQWLGWRQLHAAAGKAEVALAERPALGA